MPKRMKILMLIICICSFSFLWTGCQNSDESRIYTSLSDLEGARVGVVTGTNFDTLASQQWNECELEYLNSINDMIPALTSGKVDCFISDKPWTMYYVSENDSITYIDEVISHEDYALVFAKDENGAAIRDDFNAFLAELSEQEDFFTDLEKTWFNADEKAHPDIDYESLPSENGTIRICTEVTNPPFEFYENEKIVGYDIQLLYMYCQSRGYGMEVDDMKFDSLIPAVTSGKYDIASSSFAITPERKESVYFSDVIYKSGPVAVIRTENSVGSQSADSSNLFFKEITASLTKTFIRDSRWKLFISGIGITLLITIVSLAAGTLLGFLLFMWCRKGGKVRNAITGFFSWLIMGMPEVLMLLILFYIVFANTTITGTWVSIIAFTLIMGINVYGMMKNGVKAVDYGQMEAALAIGYSERQGFFRIILPQALQFIMPGYRESIVAMIKSTAIVGYLAVQDLTKVSDIVRSRTYEAFFPLIVTAAIYFILSWFLITIVNNIQIRLLPIRNSKKVILKGIETEEEVGK